MHYYIKGVAYLWQNKPHKNVKNHFKNLWCYKQINQTEGTGIGNVCVDVTTQKPKMKYTIYHLFKYLC